MKAIAVSCLSMVLVASSLCGQLSPSASASQSSTAESGTLTKADRDRGLEYLKQTQKDFLASTEGLSEAQWKFKAAPDRWSIAETAEHIAVAEQSIWDLISGTIMKSPATPEKRSEVKGKEETILKAIPDRSTKAQAPEELRPTGRWANRADLVKAFEGVRAKEIALVADPKEDLRNHFGEHPFLKTLDAYQWLLFNAAHCKRHTAQILEVKADPKYPKS